jgi:hypothetical protein
VSSTLPTWWVGEFMALYGQTEAVIFHMLWRLQVSKTLLFC